MEDLRYDDDFLSAALGYIERGFAVFPLDGKIPQRGSRGHKDATTDVVRVVEWWTQRPSANIGIRTGQASGIVVLDIDPRNGGDESLSNLEEQLGALPPTPTVRTGGDGRHFYFRYPESQQVKSRISLPNFPGLDIHSDGRSVVAPPSIHPQTQKVYQWDEGKSLDDLPLADLPEALTQLISEREKNHVQDDLEKVVKGERENYLTSVAGTWGRHGLTCDEIAAALMVLNKSRCEPPLQDKDIERIAKSISRYEPFSTDPGVVLRELNKEFAVSKLGSNVVILHETTDPVAGQPRVDFLSQTHFNLLLKNRTVICGSDDKTKIISASSFWLKHAQRREYKEVVFAPGDTPPGCYNLWRGFAVQPQAGDCDLMLYHIENVICAGDKHRYGWLLAWLADAVRNPDARPGTAVALRGGQGVGKGVFCTEFGKGLFGRHFKHVYHSRYVTGHFNAILDDCLVLFLDEAFWGGDKQAEGVLKGIVTESTIPIEYKGKEPVERPNRIRVLIASNSDWVVPTGLDERRFCVLDVSDIHAQDHGYFKQLIGQMENGGREAFLHHLLHYDVTRYDLRQIPDTEALRDQKLASMDSVTRFWFGRLEDGAPLSRLEYWPEEVRTEDFHNEYMDECRSLGERHPAAKEVFGKRLKELCPDLRKYRRRLTNDDRDFWRVEKDRDQFYALPPLSECRQSLDKITRTQWEWGNE